MSFPQKTAHRLCYQFTFSSPEAAILLVCARNRFLAQTRRIAASGDENDQFSAKSRTICHEHYRSNEMRQLIRTIVFHAFRPEQSRSQDHVCSQSLQEKQTNCERACNQRYTKTSLLADILYFFRVTRKRKGNRRCLHADYTGAKIPNAN